MGIFSYLLCSVWVLAIMSEARAIPEESTIRGDLDTIEFGLLNNKTLPKRTPSGARVVLTGAGWEFAVENWCWTWDPVNGDQRRQIDGANSGLFRDVNMLKYGTTRFNSSCTSPDEVPPASVVESGGGINTDQGPSTSPNRADWAVLFGTPQAEQTQQGIELREAIRTAQVQRNGQFWVDFTSNGFWCTALRNGDQSQCNNPPQGDKPTRFGFRRTSDYPGTGKQTTFQHVTS